MSWRGESWADIVARAASATPHARRGALELEDRASLAARAQPWEFPTAHLEAKEDGIVLGELLESVEIALAQLYHVEPVDPWPSIALGWVDRGASYSTVLTPRPEQDSEAFAARVEELVSRDARALSAVSKGWLRFPVLEWERVEALPGEREEGPAMRGYRMSPQVEDPIVARRTMAPGGGALLAWVWSQLVRAPRRIDAREIVLTERFVYARTRAGERLRLPASALRTARWTPAGDTIYVLGRCTELLVVRQDGCELAAALEAKVRPAE